MKPDESAARWGESRRTRAARDARPRGWAGAEPADQVEPNFALGTREIDPVRVAREAALCDDGDVTERTPLVPAAIAAMPALDLAAIPHAAFVIGATGRIEDVNPLGEELVGYTRGELVGHVMDLVISNLTCAAIARARTASDGGDHVRLVTGERGVFAHHRSRREVPVDVLLCPHGHGAVVAIVHAPPASAARDGLRAHDVSQIVHDLRNPLSTIALEASAIDARLADADHAAAKAMLVRISRNVAFIDRLVSDLLDLASFDAGAFELRRAPTDLCALLEHVVERMVATRDRPRVTIAASGPAVVRIDALRIERVVANLVQNALKHAPNTNVVVQLERDATRSRVSVNDAGPGMTRDEMTFVFDRYRRGHAARDREGTGLGLHVCKRIVEAHHGRIGVDSVVGIGTSFYFELPEA